MLTAFNDFFKCQIYNLTIKTLISMDGKKDSIRKGVKRIMREDAELAAEKSCKNERDDGLLLSHGTLSRVKFGKFPDLDKTRLAKDFSHLYDITINLRRLVRDCEKRHDKTGADSYRARIKEYGKSILKACGSF